MLTRRALPRFRALSLLLIAAAPAAARGQVASVAVDEENFRASPGGRIVAELLEGTELALGETRDRWREVTLEAWVWAPSVRADERGGYDLSVAAAEGENLRARPNGTLLGRALPGMLLERLETRDRWVRVRRTGWVWQPSLALGESAEAEAAVAAEAPDAGGAVDAAGDAPSGPAGPAPTRSGRQFATVEGGGLAVLEGPAGDTLTRVLPGAQVEVIAREGDWTRVRVEGWVVTGALGTADSTDAAVLRDPDVETLRGDPEAARGRLVEWTVQFIALQHAESFRTDFLEGEPFILARGPGDGPGFVYVAVPPEREAEVGSLTPLQRVRVLGRVRTVRSRLTDAPVIDLLELTPLE